MTAKTRLIYLSVLVGGIGAVAGLMIRQDLLGIAAGVLLGSVFRAVVGGMLDAKQVLSSDHEGSKLVSLLVIAIIVGFALLLGYWAVWILAIEGIDG